METITVIGFIVLLVFGILQIILFFKMWRMCDDVKVISSTLRQVAKDVKEEPMTSMNHGSQHVSPEMKFSTGQLVIIKENENQFRISDVIQDKGGGYLYYSEKLNKYFMEDELDDFSDYWAKKK